MGKDRAGKYYWDELWADRDIPTAVDPYRPGLNNYVNRRFHEYFKKLFSNSETRGKKLLEIGCGGSAWLPYFADEFGFEVYGLDYSEKGCKQAKSALALAGVSVNIICCDLFKPPEKMLGKFDVVFSFGVVEHYEDTAACLRALGRFLKPGSMLITVIPNLVGIVGWLQKLVNRKVYDIHVALNQKELMLAHRMAGLSVISCDYYLLANFSVMNIEKWKGKGPYEVAIRIASWASKTIWLLESFLSNPKGNSFTSPYITCLAEKQ